MAKIKFTKGELKKQRDALTRYERYLPTLQLKKQQLQLEILTHLSLRDEAERTLAQKKKFALSWAGLLAENFDFSPYLKFQEVVSSKNVAGVNLPVFERLEFAENKYDLFITPLWVDGALDALRVIVSLREEISVIVRAIEILRTELRVTVQRVNLFEKIKIPEAQENIRLIKIYLGDQMANAVGRGKIAKSKIEANIFAETVL